uniref:Uncharacterized protein n=1 Tax=Parascaris univalens TaxID=6257 RepID=A0A915BSB4_PARUN
RSMAALGIFPAAVLVIVTVVTISPTTAASDMPMWVDSRIGSIGLEKLNVAVDNYTSSYILIPWSSISKLPRFSSITEPRFLVREAVCQHFGYELPSVTRKDDLKLLKEILRSKVAKDLIMLADRIKSYPTFCFFLTLVEDKGAVQADLCTAITKFVLCVRHIISSTIHVEPLEMTSSPNTTTMSAQKALRSHSDEILNKITLSVTFISFFILTL